MEKKLYTINEFAELCEVPKSTLLVYDKKGILKPIKVGANGYRYYSPEQFYEYYVIKAFQMAGSSLAEISGILESCNRQKLSNLLITKRTELYKKQFELMRMQLFIDHMLSQEELVDNDDGKFKIKELAEEYFIAMPIEAKNISNKEFYADISVIPALNKYIKEHGYSDNILFDSGYIVSEEEVLKDNFSPTHYYCKIAFETNDSYLHIKPAGTYASYCVKGSFYDLPAHYEEFKKMVLKRGYKILGDCYISNITFSTLTFSENNVVRIISAKVKLVK